MRCGLPIVGFSAGGIQEWLIDGETGYLVPWNDHVQYARRIESLLQEKTLAQTLGENGREQVNTRFGFEQYIRDLERLLHGIVHKDKSESSRSEIPANL